MRYAQACHMHFHIPTDAKTDHTQEECLEKYSIPEGVELMLDGWVPSKTYLNLWRPFIIDWVKGRFTLKECKTVLCFLGEDYEIDWGWVFMEEPCFFYDEERLQDDLLKEKFLKIGTRSLVKRTGKAFDSVF